MPVLWFLVYVNRFGESGLFNQWLAMVSVNLGLVHYVLDHIYGTLLHRTKLGTPFFSKGWGGTKLDLLEKMVNQLFPEAHCQNWPPTAVQPRWKTLWETNNSCLREGIFRTTCDERLIDALPPESHNARVAFLTPKNITPEKMSCVVHLAGTWFCGFFIFSILFPNALHRLWKHFLIWAFGLYAFHFFLSFC